MTANTGKCIFAKIFRSGFGNKFVGNAVKTVTAQAVLFAVLFRNAIGVSVIGHGGMETGIENGDSWNTGQNFFNNFNTSEVGRVMQRSERNIITDDLLYGCVDFHFGIMRSAKKHAVSGSDD